MQLAAVGILGGTQPGPPHRVDEPGKDIEKQEEIRDKEKMENVTGPGAEEQGGHETISDGARSSA